MLTTTSLSVHLSFCYYSFLEFLEIGQTCKMSCNETIDIFLIGLMSSMKTDIRTTEIDKQQIMTFAYIFSIILLVVFAVVSNLLSIDTFQQPQLRLTTVGHYLLIYTYFSILVLLLLGVRLIQLLDSLTYAGFMSICNIITHTASIFTRICLWMNGFIAFHRALLALELNGVWNQIRSRAAATTQMVAIIVCVVLMHIPELMARRVLSDPVAPGKFVCQIKYSENLLTLNTVFSFIHLFLPVSLNMLANCLILAAISQRKATLHRRSRRSQWMKEFRRVGHLFVSPTLTTVSFLVPTLWQVLYRVFSLEICILPQSILSLRFSCVDITIKWLLRLNIAAALLIHLPQAATFLLFILSSQVYMEIFITQSRIGKYLCRRLIRRNTIAPLHTTCA